MHTFALVDCNNFYVSCERVFNPKLKNKPVVVLSNNDGCVIARSQESKDLGVEMGSPAFKWKKFFEKNNVEVFSSNYALYGDMSKRVVETLKTFTPELEVYSIDESFLLFNEINPKRLYKIALNIINTTYKWTGIPVSVGFGTTKTLAKLANRLAKKDPRSNGVAQLLTPQITRVALKRTPVSDIWGIGRKSSKRLTNKGIHTGYDFIKTPTTWIKQNLTITGLQTLYELQGKKCFTLESMPEPKKTISTSRSFGKPITIKRELEEAIAAYATRGAEKLREQKALCSGICVYIQTNKHKQTPQYSNSTTTMFAIETNYTPLLITEGLKCLNKIFKENFEYNKAGIVLLGLVNIYQQQTNLLTLNNQEQEHKKSELMNIVDFINNKYGKKSLNYASAGIEQLWQMNRKFKSPDFTTKWTDIPIVK